MDEEIAEVVRQHGWYAANVYDHTPPFLYTIGLMQTFRHPEFIVFGLEAPSAHALLSALVNDLRYGKTYSERAVHTIQVGDYDHRIGLRAAHPTQHPLYLGFAMGFVRWTDTMGDLQAMQVFWPDSKGKFPFDAGCAQEVYALQPRLDIPLTPREIRQFERQWESCRRIDRITGTADPSVGESAFYQSPGSLTDNETREDE